MSEEIIDPFRKSYIPQDAVQQTLVKNIKDAATELNELFLDVEDKYDTRCSYIARTKLEEAVMWAVKGATSVKSRA